MVKKKYYTIAYNEIKNKEYFQKRVYYNSNTWFIGMLNGSPRMCTHTRTGVGTYAIM